MSSPGYTRVGQTRSWTPVSTEPEDGDRSTDEVSPRSETIEIPPVGVLVMSYGTPGSAEDIAGYYTHIRRGHPPTAEQLADLVRRYDAIGGVSPMRERTDEQIRAITDHLRNSHDDRTYRVVPGQKHAAPFIEDGIEQLVSHGVTMVVGLVLAPHYSAASVGQYHDRARAAIADTAPDVTYRPIDDWSTMVEFIHFTAAEVVRSLKAMPARTTVCFTAHSLPLRSLVDDPYEEQLTTSAVAIATAAGVTDRYRVMTGWQSAGRTPEPWAGPDILEIIDDAGRDPETDGLLVVPQGFTSDHLELLYDLDIDARAAAERVGLAMARTNTINADPTVMGGLAGLITAAAR